MCELCEVEEFVVIEDLRDKRIFSFGPRGLWIDGGQYRGRKFAKTMNADDKVELEMSVGDSTSWSERTHMTTSNTTS